MTMPNATLGTLLRSLLDELDPAVEAEYANLGLDFRPRFTPVIRALMQEGPSRIKDIAAGTGLTHSAVSQTISALIERDWVRLETGQDSRERIVHLTDYARSQLPRLKKQWAATARAAASLNEDIGMPLEQVLRSALAALEKKSFAERLKKARPK
ncbi:MarR family winged helix-turn-helix transcriptional regulator [Lysobacter sp.]|uniref:MarR family winged helix-turn-helix transcriptional regulator n=1 Tax=Lysobacter sp. TaxID=72226 RepID=UPI002D773AF2|nr:MarR family winged helix-turn-helix transcriptional regulator [Lysobacter sp.]